MSHIVTIEAEVRDRLAVEAACRRVGLGPPTEGTAHLFSGEASGLLVQLPDWRYPVVCDTSSGRLQYDNFGGRWGAQEELDQLMQAYAVEMAKLQARRQGHGVTEQELADGSIRVSIHLGGTP